MVCSYVFGISRSSSYIKVIGSRSQEQKSVCILFAGGLPSSEKQCCLSFLGNADLHPVHFMYTVYTVVVWNVDSC